MKAFDYYITKNYVALETVNSNFLIKSCNTVGYYNPEGDLLKLTDEQEFSWAINTWGKSPVFKVPFLEKSSLENYQDNYPSDVDDYFTSEEYDASKDYMVLYVTKRKEELFKPILEHSSIDEKIINQLIKETISDSSLWNWNIEITTTDQVEEFANFLKLEEKGNGNWYDGWKYHKQESGIGFYPKLIFGKYENTSWGRESGGWENVNKEIPAAFQIDKSYVAIKEVLETDMTNKIIICSYNPEP